MRDYDIYETIRRIVREELIYYRHYYGSVRNDDDPKGLGRIDVYVPELRTTYRCAPRYNPGVSVPAIGSVVEIYFVEGKPNRPVWIGRVAEQEEKVKNYSKGVDVPFESQSGQGAITYDERTGVMSLQTGDASTWQPNILKVDPLTGLPHGGIGGGIVKLRGK